MIGGISNEEAIHTQALAWARSLAGRLGADATTISEAAWVPKMPTYECVPVSRSMVWLVFSLREPNCKLLDMRSRDLSREQALTSQIGETG